jgi:RNA polymerase sigma-70 factor (ECF subfamily)
MTASANGATLDAQVGLAFRQHERVVWGLCYRMTGSAADADDLVQETFTRALASPPADREQPWRPWLVRVAINLAHDALRRRRRQPYAGPWLPSPIETDDEPPAHEPVVTGTDGRPLTTEGRYDLMESVSFGFLVALEALTPRQRAVLLLRDVFDYAVEETATALGMSASNVKTTHHRARAVMAAYDRTRVVPGAGRTSATQEMLGRFLVAVRDGQPRDVEALLASDVRALNDGGGEFIAARTPVVGRNKVARFYHKITRLGGSASARVRLTMLNGLPGLVVDSPDAPAGIARRFVVMLELDAAGYVRRIYNVLATPKLAALA